MEKDEIFMKEALAEAEKAFREGEVPVGAVIVLNDEIIGRGHNTVEREKSSTRHAEINAIEDAERNLKSTRLLGAVMYVTLEPCPMCAGAILNSRLSKVIYGAKDEDGGAMGGLIDLSKLQPLKGPNLKTGVLSYESCKLLERFFKNLR